MEKKIPLTQYAFDILSEKRKKLEDITNKKSKPTIERQREINAAKKELHEVEPYLRDGFVRNFNEKQPAMVQVGSVVVIEDMANGKRQEFRIMTRVTADPLNAVISNESPLAQKMLGLNLKNTFKFKDNYGREESYKIISIE
jgi:transcription elongation factor GreA